MTGWVTNRRPSRGSAGAGGRRAEGVTTERWIRGVGGVARRVRAAGTVVGSVVVEEEL